MGQKINPIGFASASTGPGIQPLVRDNGEYGKLLHEDLKIREYLMKPNSSRPASPRS
jgi:small subunit ribosomal protein S3